MSKIWMRKIRRSACRETGQTLVLALIIMGALTITTAGVITFMTSNETSAGRDRQVVSALSAAEAGLSNGMSWVLANNSDNDLGTHPVGQVLTFGPTTVDGNSVSWTLTKSSSTDNSTTPPTTTYYWTVDSTATNRNNVTREVSQQVKYIEGVDIDESAVFQYGLFVGAPAPGTNPPCLITLHGNVSVKANVWIGGNLCTQGGVALTPAVAHTLNMFVVGYFNGNGSGTIGTSALPFANAQIKGGCSASQPLVCSSGTAVWADSYNPPPPFPDLKKPTVDVQQVYDRAQSSDWTNRCTGAAGLVLDSNTAASPDQSAPTGNNAQELFPNKDYDCTVPMAGGSTSTMTWNHTTNVFTITGTIFIDGDVQMSNGATWTGDGSLYVNGTVTKKSNFNTCGPPKTITRTGSTTNNSTTVSGLSQTSDLSTGMGISGAGIANGTTISSITNASTIVISPRATATGTPSLTFTSGASGYGCPTTWDTSSISRAATTTTGSTQITGLSATSDLSVGMYIEDFSLPLRTTFPIGTTITSITNSSTIVVSNAATSSGTSTLKFRRGDFGIVILNPQNATYGFNSNGNGQLDMDMYVVSGFANTGGTVVTGSVITDGGDVGGGTGVLNPQDPPPDFPKNYHTPDIGWATAPSSWKELK